MAAVKSKNVIISERLPVGEGQKLLLIAGPCQIESLEHCLMIASRLKEICEDYPINLVFKSSFDKANRTSAESKRGPGLEKGLEILKEVGHQTDLPTLTDIHHPEQAPLAAQAVDIIQIPAFLCRQTDLLTAAGAAGKPVNIKKGQFMHAVDMLHCADKVASQGNTQILLCERGTCFGYRDLVVDMRNLVILKETGYPVIFDAGHSVQSMGGAGGSSGGLREFIKPLARAAVAVGIDGLFIECHEKPGRAPSDGESMLPLDEIKDLVDMICSLSAATAGAL